MDFDWSEILKIISYLVPAVVFVIFNVIMRKQQEQKRRLTVVKGLIAEIDQNQKLMEAFLIQWHYKKFKTGHWERNKAKLDYVDPGLRNRLADTYQVIAGYNREIETAKKQKSLSYLAGIRMDKLRDPLAKSRQGLEEWYDLNKGLKKPPEEEKLSS